MRRLSDTEYEIMDYVWSLKPPFTTALVMEGIGNERGWKMQTAVTLLNRLMDRGFIRAEKPEKGRERRLYPVITRRNTCATRRTASCRTITRAASPA